MSITSGDKTKIIKEMALTKVDTGSVEVQVAVITKRIANLTEHFKGHKKDNHSRRGLLKLISKRKSLLGYLKSRDEARYRSLISTLGLRG